MRISREQLNLAFKSMTNRDEKAHFKANLGKCKDAWYDVELSHHDGSWDWIIVPEEDIEQDAVCSFNEIPYLVRLGRKSGYVERVFIQHEKIIFSGLETSRDLLLGKDIEESDSLI